MRIATLCAFAILLCASARAGGQVVSGGGFPANGLIMTAQAACPSGWTEVTTYAGMFIVAMPASGNAGDTLGTGIASTSTNLTITATAACTASPNVVTTAGTIPVCEDSPAPTITMGSTANQRSELTPFVSLRLCTKT